METITVDVGVYTPFTVDLSEFDFTNIEKVILTFKNPPFTKSGPLIMRTYTEPKVYNDVITPAESIRLSENTEYDFNIIVASNNNRYKVGENGFIKLRRGCGQCQTV